MPPFAILSACTAQGPVDRPTPSTPSTPLAATVSTPFANPLAVSIATTGAGSVAVDVACTAADDPGDVLTATGDGAEVAVAGLRPDTDYDCVVSAGSQTTATSARAELGRAPPPLVVAEPGDGLWTAFVLIEGADRSAWVVDPLGRPRWTVALTPDPGTSPSAGWFAEPDGDGLLVGGGRAFLPRTLDARGEVVRSFPPPLSGDGVHHDATLVEGGLLELTYREEVDGGVAWDGFGLELVEDGAAGPTWTWTSREGVDAGDLPVPIEVDPFHANAVRPDPDGRTVWVSLRNASSLLHVDPETGEVIERLGADADVVLPAEHDRLRLQHDPTFVDDRVIVYDNGDLGRKSTRVLELRLPDGPGEAEVLRSFTEDGWYEPVMGGVHVLGDGRWLVTRAHCDGVYCLGNDPEDRTELLLVDPDTGTVSWRLRFTTVESIYRARAVDPCLLLGACLQNAGTVQ